MIVTMYELQPAPPLLLLPLPLLLPMLTIHQVNSAPLCLVGDVFMQCYPGWVILVESAFLGVSEGHDRDSGYCPKTSDKCHQQTERASTLCNRRATCSLAYPRDTVINLPNGCGQTNYIDVSFTCVEVSTAINICGWIGERGSGTSYIVNNNYPLAIPPQPHRCQCTIQRHPDFTAGVALIVKDAYFTGPNCQQKLYVEFPGHSTQSSTVCSGSQRVIGRTIFSRASIQHEEIISLTYDKVRRIADGGTFLIEVQATGPVAITCNRTTVSPPTSTTRTFTTSTTLSTGSPHASTSRTSSSTPSVYTQYESQDQNNTTSKPTTDEPGQPNLDVTGLIAGAAVGGVLLIIIIIVIVVLITRFRRKARGSKDANSPQASSKPFNGKTTVQDNKGNNTDSRMDDSQLTGDMQMYAVIPEQENNAFNHRKEKNLTEDSPKVASKMDTTTFNVQAPDDPNLPTETYAVVDRTKKTKAKAEPNHSPNQYINVDINTDNGKATTPAAAASTEDPLYDEAVECRVRPIVKRGGKKNQETGGSPTEGTTPASPNADSMAGSSSEATYDTVIRENELYDQ